MPPTQHPLSNFLDNTVNSLADRTSRTEQILNDMKKKEAKKQNDQKQKAQLQARVQEANRRNTGWAEGSR